MRAHPTPTTTSGEPYFYGRLGFFARYAAAEEFLLRVGSEVGYDLRECLTEWRATGCFMHSHNHPRIHVLYTLARVALAKAGREADTTRGPDQIVDRLADDARWPVYPEVARALGTEGDLVFEKAIRASRGGPRGVSLDDYVAASYAAYDAVGGALDPNGRLESARKVIRSANVRWPKTVAAPAT